MASKLLVWNGMKKEKEKFKFEKKIEKKFEAGELVKEERKIQHDLNPSLFLNTISIAQTSDTERILNENFELWVEKRRDIITFWPLVHWPFCKNKIFFIDDILSTPLNFLPLEWFPFVWKSEEKIKSDCFCFAFRVESQIFALKRCWSGLHSLIEQNFVKKCETHCVKAKNSVQTDDQGLDIPFLNNCSYRRENSALGHGLIQNVILPPFFSNFVKAK